MLSESTVGSRSRAIRWHSGMIGQARQRNEAWEQILAASHLPWSLGARPRENFQADLHYRTFDGYTLARCQCTTLDGYRSSSEIARTSEAFVSLLYLCEGEEKIVTESKELIVSRGDIVLWDSTQKMKFSVPRKVDKISLLIPEKNMSSLFPRVHDYTGTVVRRDNRMNAVIGGHLLNLASRMRVMKESELTLLVDASMNLFVTALRSGITTASSNRQATLGRIKQHIIENLGDPFLSPRQIAEDMGMSLRYLYTLFESEGVGVSEWIRERRLHCAKKELVSAMADSSTITDIAFKWGFCDLSHFSKAFKQSFGQSPRDFVYSMKPQPR